MPVKMPKTLKCPSEKAKKPSDARKIKGFKTSVQLMDKTDIVCTKTDSFQVCFHLPRNVSTDGFSRLTGFCAPPSASGNRPDKSDLAIYTPENI